MMTIKRGEIWLVNLDPTIGHEIQKTRPGLIIQNDLGNKYSPITIIAPLTSQHLDRTYPVEILLPKHHSGLEKDSKVLLNQLRAIDKRRLVRKIGTITLIFQNQVDEAIKISLGLIAIPDISDEYTG